MRSIKRIIYLAYYFKQLSFEQFWKFLKFDSRGNPLVMIYLVIDCIISVLCYNISILEYFQFRFINLSSVNRSEWAGTGYMFEFQLKMNPKEHRHLLENKLEFLDAYKDFVLHKSISLQSLKDGKDDTLTVIHNSSEKIVLKDSKGQCGYGVEIIPSSRFTTNQLIDYMQEKGFDMIEAFVLQADSLNELSPSALNTIRVFTQLDSNNIVHILGCRLRISVNSNVDNMASGNLAATIDPKSGIVTGPGVYSDITKDDCLIHPITNIPILGFQIPFWNEVVELVKAAALHNITNRSIGWDVAITNSGPGLIEGNHNWCKLLWQLPEKKGLKSVLKEFE